MHTTNYQNAFISTADDCPEATGKVPPQKAGEPGIATLQFQMLKDAPYVLTSDDVLFAVHAARTGLAEEKMAEERAKFFSKGQPCLRASPLTKRWGWGVHNDAEGRVALYAAGSPEYEKLLNDASLKQWKAMRSKRA